MIEVGSWSYSVDIRNTPIKREFRISMGDSYIPVVDIKADGKVIVHRAPDEASRVFWECVEGHFKTENSVLRAENEKFRSFMDEIIKNSKDCNHCNASFLAQLALGGERGKESK